MIMTTPTIADCLKYANLQMAAEAFIRNVETDSLASTGQSLIDALKAGNNHASFFTETEAKKFSEHWKILDQKANTLALWSVSFYFFLTMLSCNSFLKNINDTDPLIIERKCL
jgi:hypothetical protein